MDKICEFLKDYYTDNGISEYKSMIAFKYTKKNNNYQNLDYIIKELKSRIKTCLTDIEIVETPKRKSVRFEYTSNLCEIYTDNIKGCNYWFLIYY